jgi:hypothetical protein
MHELPAVKTDQKQNIACTRKNCACKLANLTSASYATIDTHANHGFQCMSKKNQTHSSILSDMELKGR